MSALEPAPLVSEYSPGVGDLLEISYFKGPPKVETDYPLHVNDRIYVEFTYYPDLDSELVIPPDGHIHLKKVGRILAAGRSLAELTREITRIFSEKHSQPEVVVSLMDHYNSTNEFFSLLGKGSGGQSREATIRADGKIGLPLIGDVQAAGVPLADLTERLNEKYSQILPELVVTLTVANEQSRKVLVLGEVNQAGLYPMVGPSTLIEAISMAKGCTDSAYLKGIYLIRRQSETPRFAVIDFHSQLTSEVSKQYYLMPYDIVYVPKAPVTRLSTVLRQVYALWPSFVHFGFNYNLNNEDDEVR